MSVRAYKVITKKYEDEPTFNLWHDEKLVEFLTDETDFYSTLNDEGGGIGILEVIDIKKIIKKAKELGLDQEQVDQFKKDIEGLSDDNLVEYECF